MGEQKIEDCMPVLYNVMFTGRNEHDQCFSQVCKDGQCICMDNEQAGLLRKLMSEEDQIAMCFAGERAFFQNLQNRVSKEYFCTDAPTERDVYCEKLFHNRHFPEEKEKLGQLVNLYRACPNRFMNVIQSIPILYTINSLFEIKERNTLVYLCRYAPCIEAYISILLRAIICRTIGCCKKAENQGQKKEYVRELAKLLNKLAKVLAQNNTEMEQQYIISVSKYIDMWGKVSDSYDKAAVGDIIDKLKNYEGKLWNQEEKPIVVNSMRNCDKLYKILRKIHETAGLPLFAFPDLFSADFEQDETDYDDVICILNNVKNDANKQEKILTILSRVFWSGEDIPKEELDEMRKIVQSSELENG